ncbi:MAG TPA: metallophosphoesterase [Candidatus Kapabacteria bacterium]|nr:metallophosphoesterase [Candidatus Kapabacteria bacterium]
MKSLLIPLVFFLFIFTNQSAYSQPTDSDIPTYSGNALTADTSSSFIIAGDLQLQSPILEFWRENNRAAVGAICGKIALLHPGFLFVLGDLTFDGASEKLWRTFDAYAKPIRDSNIRTYPLLGNHEYFTNKRKMFYQYSSRFSHINEQLWYLIKWHDVAIIALNSNFSKLTKKERRLQDEWYGQVLRLLDRDKSVASIIVACHHPPYTNSTVVSDDQTVQEHFVLPFKQSPKSVLFITGHCHSYEHFVIDGKNFIVSGGGGPRQELEESGDSLKQDHYNPSKEDSLTLYKKHSMNCIRPHHFCKVSRVNGKLILDMEQVSEDLKTWTIGETVTLR